MALTAINTNKGPVTISSEFPTGGYDLLAFGFDVSDAIDQPIYTQKQTLKHFAATGGSVSLALFKERIIVGYAVIAPPSPDTRWAGIDQIMELKAVEVAQPFRSQGIAGHLLTHLFSGAAIDDHIVFLTAYAWLWNVARIGLSKGAYRKMLVDLYTKFGFVTYKTNEPNVCLKSENLFMARIGKNVSQKEQEVFKWLRFGIIF